jgi:hypothetical protein
MMEANQWNGVSNKGGKSAFITVGSSKEPVCWNCGGGHRLPDCTLPQNQVKISESKKKMQDAMKKVRRNAGGSANGVNRNGASSGKFRKLNANEKNRRTIDGNIMFYHKKTKRWIHDRFPLGAKVTHEAVVVAPAPLATTAIVSIPPARANVNTSGKAGAQIPQLPLGDNSPPWGDNAICV